MEGNIQRLATRGDSAMKVEIYETSKDGKVIELLEPVPFVLNGEEYVVPKGYLSNGFSCPRFLWTIISPAIDHRTLKSACVHDWLYENHVCTRDEADHLFLEMLIEAGMSRQKACTIYLAVRFFGESHYFSTN